MRFLKILSFLMVVALLFCTVISCKKIGDDGDDVQVTLPIDETNPMYEEDGDGRDFTILGRELQPGCFLYYEVAPEDTTNQVYAAIYERNAHVNKTFNVNIVEAIYSSIGPKVESDVMAGLGEYDIVMPTSNIASQMCFKGYLLEWGLIPYIDMEQEYWLSSTFETTSIKGYNYFCPSASNISAYNAACVLFFNEHMAAQNKLENPYDLVRDGKWTVEKFKEMCKKVTADSDGQQGMTSNDTYGLLTGTHVYIPFLYSSGLKLIEKNADDMPYIAGLEGGTKELVINLLSQISTFSSDRTMSIMTAQMADFSTVASSEDNYFEQNKALFWENALYSAGLIYDMEYDYGILPIPKWNEASDYVTGSYVGWTSVMCLTRVVSDVGLSGAVMEEMAKASQEIVIPEFVEKTVYIRGARNEDAYEMLSYVHSNIVIDLAMVMNVSGIDFDTSIRSLLTYGLTSFSNMFDTAGPSQSKTLESLASQFVTIAEEQYAGQ